MLPNSMPHKNQLPQTADALYGHLKKISSNIEIIEHTSNLDKNKVTFYEIDIGEQI